MDFLELAGKTILVLGVANRKSVALHVGAVVNAGRRQGGLFGAHAGSAKRPWPNCCPRQRFTSATSNSPRTSRDCTPTSPPTIRACTGWSIRSRLPITVSGPAAFHETPKAAFLRSVDISCYSLIALSDAFKDQFDPDASVVATSISTTRMASENYGFMAPIKAALDFVAGVFGEIVQPFFARPVQRRGARLAQNFGFGRHSRLRRRLSVRRTGHASQAGRGDRRGGQRLCVPAQSPLQRHQRPEPGHRRRHVGQLFRSGSGATGDAGGINRKDAKSQRRREGNRGGEPQRPGDTERRRKVVTRRRERSDPQMTQITQILSSGAAEQ